MKHAPSNIAIRLSGISKHYTIHHEKPTLVERVGLPAGKHHRDKLNIFPFEMERFDISFHS